LPRSSPDRLVDNVSRAIYGKRDVIELLVVALLAPGHVLIEDVPGVGKTTLVRALALSTGCRFSRIQFTPDLLPSDVTGASVLGPDGKLRFEPGPIMSNLVLADEINRASPKTQSSLLECMEERQVTVEGRTYRLEEPFMVLATQNPIEYEGTFPLPEAQLDRFLLKVKVGYPDPRAEKKMLMTWGNSEPLTGLEAVATPADVVEMQASARRVRVDPSITDYILRIVRRTRNHPGVYLGASPRASLALYRATRALAFIRGRSYVTPDDVKALVLPVLAHRILLEADSGGAGADEFLRDLLRQVPVPVEGGNSGEAQG